MLLSNATVHSVEDGVLTVLFAREGEAKGFSGSGDDRDLISALNSVLGTTLRIKALSAAQLAATPGSPPAARRPGQAQCAGAIRGAAARATARRVTAPHPVTRGPAGQRPGRATHAGLTGMDLIKRELGGQIIAEIDEGAAGLEPPRDVDVDLSTPSAVSNANINMSAAGTGRLLCQRCWYGKWGSPCNGTQFTLAGGWAGVGRGGGGRAPAGRRGGGS